MLMINFWGQSRRLGLRALFANPSTLNCTFHLSQSTILPNKDLVPVMTS